MDYDEDRELTTYAWEHYTRLMTEFELRVGRAIIPRAKAAASDNPEMASALNRHWGATGDPEVEAALAGGAEAFRRRVRERMLAERGGELFVNRCPRCGWVVRTPKALKCFWCGFDWHASEAHRE